MPATDPVATRDKAILLIGWAGALRRSEIAELDRKHAVFTPEGVVITIASSKTDQEGEGVAIPIEPASNPDLCPVSALRAWLGACTLDTAPSSPLFPARTSVGSRPIASRLGDQRGHQDLGA